MSGKVQPPLDRLSQCRCRAVRNNMKQNYQSAIFPWDNLGYLCPLHPLLHRVCLCGSCFLLLAIRWDKTGVVSSFSTTASRLAHNLCFSVSLHIPLYLLLSSLIIVAFLLVTSSCALTQSSLKKERCSVEAVRDHCSKLCFGLLFPYGNLERQINVILFQTSSGAGTSCILKGVMIIHSFLHLLYIHWCHTSRHELIPVLIRQEPGNALLPNHYKGTNTFTPVLNQDIC